MTASEVIEDNRAFFDAVVLRAAAAVKGGAPVEVAIEKAMRDELNFEAEMAQHETKKAKVGMKHLAATVYREIIVSTAFAAD